MARVANWLNVLGLVCTMALLISFVVLPADKSRRHYLTVCLVVGVTMMQVRWVKVYLLQTMADRLRWPSSYP